MIYTFRRQESKTKPAPGEWIGIPDRLGDEWPGTVVVACPRCGVIQAFTCHVEGERPQDVVSQTHVVECKCGFTATGVLENREWPCIGWCMRTTVSQGDCFRYTDWSYMGNGQRQRTVMTLLKDDQPPPPVFGPSWVAGYFANLQAENAVPDQATHPWGNWTPLDGHP